MLYLAALDGDLRCHIRLHVQYSNLVVYNVPKIKETCNRSDEQVLDSLNIIIASGRFAQWFEW